MQTACVCDEKGISREGRYSKALACEGQPIFLDAVENGVEWRVVDPKVIEKWPVAIDIVCNADNVASAFARTDNPLEIMKKILKEASLSSNGIHESKIPWNQVQARVEKTEFARREDIPNFVEFVKHCSGGIENPWILDAITEHARVCERCSHPSPRARLGAVQKHRPTSPSRVFI